MEAEPRRGVFSRRQFLARNAWAVGLALAACASPQAATSPTSVAKPAGQPTSPPGAAQQPAPPTVAAATAPAAAAAQTTSGVFNVWFNANWNEVTDKAVGDIFVQWGQQNGLKVEWQSIPGSPDVLAKQSAAIAAGKPPEVVNANLSYWYGQGEIGDLTELVGPFKGNAGGMYEVALSALRVGDGALIGAPYAIDPWPAHWRMDVIGPVTGGRFFDSYEELITLGPKVQQPPRTYCYAMAMGHEGDTVNNLCSLLWAYGGRIADEKGVPDIINPANKAPLDVAARMFQAKLIPPDTFASTVTSWNNEAYQKGRGMIAVNPATIMGWLLVNDAELADKTGLSLPPKGPAGTFAEAGAIGFNYFKKAPLVAKAPSAIEFFLRPDNLLKVSNSVQGRFVPVYRAHATGEFWETSKFAELKNIAEVGRIREYPAPPQQWLADVTDARYTLSNMLQKVINDKMPIEDAQQWAQQDMMDAYNKTKKA